MSLDFAICKNLVAMDEFSILHISRAFIFATYLIKFRSSSSTSWAFRNRS